MLKLKNISKYYHSNEVVALGLRKVSLEFNLGEFVAVTGESGSGKSTLLNVISGLDTYEDGEMYINSEETSYYSIEEWEAFRRQYIGFVFQNYNIIDSYSVLENVMIALTIQGYNPELRKARALELIDKVGLTSHINHKASKLSGGQKQRCVIARALAKDCPIIVADEPTGNLDSESGKIIMSLLQEISKDKLVIVVTHNFDQVAPYATRKIRMFDGEVVEDKTIKKVKEVTKELVVPTFTMKLKDLMGISLKNLLRTPRRTIFTTIVTIFTVIIFVFSYGNYIGQTSSTGNFMGGGYFGNVTDSRIIVTKFDNTSFTPEELTELNNLRLVRTVMEHDVILDELIFSYQEVTYNNGESWINSQENYLNPASMLKNSQLIKGTFPTNEHEVVIEETEGYDVGDTIVLGYSYPYDSDDITSIPNTTSFTITGIAETVKLSEWRGRMYFHEDFLNNPDVIARAYIKSANWGKVPLSIRVLNDGLDVFYIYGGEGITIDNSVEDNEIHISTNSFSQLLETLDLSEDEPLSVIDGYTFNLIGDSAFAEKEIDVEITNIYEPSERNWSNVSMNSDTINKLLPDGVYQVGVLVFDEYDAQKVIEDIDELGYNTIYPNGVTDQFSAIFAIFTSIYLAFILGFLMIVIYFITYIVLKNIQNSKKKDYLILRSIGASKRDLNRVTIIELIFTTVFAYIVTMSLFILNENIVSKIPRYLRYFTAGSHILIFFLMIVLAVMLGRRFNKRIFGKSVITSLKQE
ncbi:MAG: ABC transporter ATP-binding protein/permease [Candidatus Izimaplasma sp.]|nr:ABC transporter ATP-binding protein/permease [Candidatus Izimaplasma bacterium]